MGVDTQRVDCCGGSDSGSVRGIAGTGADPERCNAPERVISRGAAGFRGRTVGRGAGSGKPAVAGVRAVCADVPVAAGGVSVSGMAAGRVDAEARWIRAGGSGSAPEPVAAVEGAVPLAGDA